MAKAQAAESKTSPVKADKPKSGKTKASKPAKPSVFARLGQYFHDVRSEMRRVVWPGRAEVINSSIVVVVTLLFFVLFTLIVDSVVQWLLFDLISKIKVG